jgi:hypothetical protein
MIALNINISQLSCSFVECLHEQVWCIYLGLYSYAMFTFSNKFQLIIRYGCAFMFFFGPR